MTDTSNVAALYARLPPVALAAHQVADAANAAGIPCYVRCWHLGQTGWFVVRVDKDGPADYERMNFPGEVELMSSLSLNNRRLIQQAARNHQECGCYFCVQTFVATEITHFTSDDSALCPHCETDAVLVGVTDVDVLSAGLERWFSVPASAETEAALG